MDYPRYITRLSKPFDPIKVSEMTEMMVCRKTSRKYTAFYSTGVYGGITTGYVVGCNLRCVFCWTDWSRDFPEVYGSFYTHEEAFINLMNEAMKKGLKKMRLSGGEPTLCREHLISLLELIENSQVKLFVLETNGLTFGMDKSYVRKIGEFRKVHVRLCIKAGTPEDFTKKTGCKSDAFDIPFNGIRNLLDEGVSFHVAAMSADPRFMDKTEREKMLKKLIEIHPSLPKILEEEVVDLYPHTVARLKASSFWKKLNG